MNRIDQIKFRYFWQECLHFILFLVVYVITAIITVVVAPFCMPYMSWVMLKNEYDLDRTYRNGSKRREIEMERQDQNV